MTYRDDRDSRIIGLENELRKTKKQLENQMDPVDKKKWRRFSIGSLAVFCASLVGFVITCASIDSNRGAGATLAHPLAFLIWIGILGFGSAMVSFGVFDS